MSQCFKKKHLAPQAQKKDDKIMIRPADKGCPTVVLDKSEYQSKMGEPVNNKDTYSPLKSDPPGWRLVSSVLFTSIPTNDAP